MPDFNVYDFLRKMEGREFDSTFCDELDELSYSELEQFALVITNELRAKAAEVR